MENFVNKLAGGNQKEGGQSSRPEGQSYGNNHGHGYSHNQEQEAGGGGLMGKLGGMVGGKEGGHSQHEAQQQSSGGFMGKLNTMAGGGPESEKNEDALDKGMSSPCLHRGRIRACLADGLS
jgi:hypothetical protein